LQGSLAISQLSIGDRVQTVLDDGSVAYTPIYMKSHADTKALARFVKLETQDGSVLHLTPDHYLPVQKGMPGTGAGAQRSIRSADVAFKAAAEVAQGDYVLLAPGSGAHAGHGQHAVLSQVSNVSLVIKQGLFNPYTLNGRIVVDGVVASCHSHWFLEALVPARLSGYILPVYDALLAPVRWLYAAKPDAVAAWHARHSDVFSVAYDVQGMFKAFLEVAASG
jgi:hypothetical protein